jgi:hypothetical protein
MVLILSFFVRQKSLYSKKEPKSASRRLNKLKKRVLKNFLDEIVNYRSAGPGPKEKCSQDQSRDRKKITETTTGTGTK